MLIIKEIKIRLKSSLKVELIAKVLLAVYILWKLIIVGISNAYILNYSFVMLFFIIIQAYIDEGIRIDNFFKIYYGNKVYIYIILQMLIINLFLVPVVWFLNVGILMYFLLSIVYSVVFMSLELMDLNSYTNILIILIFSNVLTLIPNIVL